MKRKLSHLWITDPWHTLDHSKDTTLRWMEEASLSGIQQFWCDVKSIRLESHRVLLDAKQIQSVQPQRGFQAVEWGETKIKLPSEFSSLHYRTDPPVDLAYIHPLHLLGLGLRGAKHSELVNPLTVLLSMNEKMEAATLKDLMPPSLVSCQWEALLGFGQDQGRTVLKPLHEAQSHGIELLDWRSTDSTANARAKLLEATKSFQNPVILQAYLEGIAEGETRLWFLDGKLLAYVKKLPITGDFRVNMDRGSRLSVTRLKPREKAAATKISKHLKTHKIRLAAVDLIENYVTDFNFTSPGLIPAMETLLGENLSKKIVSALF